MLPVESQFLRLIFHICDSDEEIKRIILLFDLSRKELIFRKIKESLINSLNQKWEPEVFKYRILDGFTLKEVGDIICRSKERVRQIEDRVIRKLRHPSIIKKVYESLNFLCSP